MTKHFCDKCGAEAYDSVQTADLKIGERKKFQLRAIFELVEEPAPCGSVGLSSPRTSSADICRACMFEMIEGLKLKIQNKSTQ